MIAYLLIVGTLIATFALSAPASGQGGVVNDSLGNGPVTVTW